MATYIRNNAWNDGGTFSNSDLLWYAQGVGQMMSRPLDATDSWWFFAAIHGEYVSGSQFPGWADIPGPPNVPALPLPSQGVRDRFWNQCQHQSWFFPPWHRGYLFALELHIREAVVSLGGPSSWALPYWDYLGPANQNRIPPAFTLPGLPDGTQNPLFVTARYGPNSDGDIFVSPQVSEDCMSNNLYTGSNAATPRPGFGGPQTGFSHGGGRNGNLESNPHNLVHVDVGGQSPNRQTWGLMSDPGIAALDPIFYLHHSNIDRMWAKWNAAGNSNTDSSSWLNGPAFSGERIFSMPLPDGSAWDYTPADVESLNPLDYTYDNLPTAVQPQMARSMLAKRLTRLGAGTRGATSMEESNMDTTSDSELVGANDKPLELTSSGVRVTVKLDTTVRQKMTRSLSSASAAAPPDRAYLQLENVRGAGDAHKLSVFVNGSSVGTVALFGLRRASLKDDHHAGSGLTFELDITDIVDRLHLDNALDADSLDVKVMPNGAVSDSAKISIGRVSVHREGHK